MPRPSVPCCKPWRLGSKWRHQSRCPEYPNQEVGYERAHPAGSARDRAEEKWLRSPMVGPLDEWAQYFDDHTDDDDDEADIATTSWITSRERR